MFALLAQIAAALQPGLIKITVDSVLGNEPLTHTALERLVALFGAAAKGTNGLLIMAALILAFAICRSIFTFLQMNTANAATERVIQNVRNRLYNHIQLLPYTYHANAKTGNLIQRCTSDIDTIRIALYSQIPETVGSVFLIIYTVFLMIQSNIKLALISCAAVPVAAAFSALFFYVIEKQFKASTEREAAMTAVLQESLTGIRVIKAFTRQQYEMEKFKTVSEAYMRRNLILIRCFAFFWSGADFLSYTQIFTVILYGSFLAYRGEISAGMLIAFISYITMLIQPVRQLGRILGNIGKACVSAGRIERSIDKGWIRSQIGLILQEPFLYAKTVMENIKLAAPDTSDAAAQRYARIAALDGEIHYFADGYATLVGERGVSLSGGQKQRLAIARTLIKDSPILIFDDSLSAVDVETDAAIRAALKNENKHKTVIIISHRIATVKDADIIIVLEKGKITEQGTHRELIQRDGLYKRIYDIQSNRDR
jgi:hypothetical protein